MPVPLAPRPVTPILVNLNEMPPEETLKPITMSAVEMQTGDFISTFITIPVIFFSIEVGASNEFRTTFIQTSRPWILGGYSIKEFDCFFQQH
jgi:hypothetical protein